MKRFLALALAATVGILTHVVAASAATISDYPNGVAANGIAGSRHNLGSYGIHVVADGTTEICVFCHAPHHGGSTTGPLWNRVNQNATFTPYGVTIGGTSVGNPGGASLACLSCHDGITTFDTLINAPGKGNNGSNNKTATKMGWTFTEDGTSKDDKLNSTRLTIGASFMEVPGSDNDVDLTDDHPISITYTAGKASLRPTGTAFSSIDLTAGLNSSTPSPNVMQNRWSVNGSITDSASISALLRNGKVECSSCHDPHFSNKSWDEVESTWGGETDSDGMFLRRVGGNTFSAVCRTCHNK